MNIKFHKQHIHAYAFNFKMNQDYELGNQTEIKATVEIPTNYKVEVRKNEDTKQLGIAMAIPLELKSPAFDFSCEYEILFVSDEINENIYNDDLSLKKSMEKSLPKVLSNYLNLVNKEIVSFINKKTSHEVNSDVNFFKNLSAKVGMS